MKSRQGDMRRKLSPPLITLYEPERIPHTDRHSLAINSQQVRANPFGYSPTFRTVSGISILIVLALLLGGLLRLRAEPPPLMHLQASLTGPGLCGVFVY